MRVLPSMLARSGLARYALGVAVVALPAALAVPAGASGATSVKHSLLAFKNLSLENGWIALPSKYGQGVPASAVDSFGVVRLSGTMTQYGNSKKPAFVLPIGERPSRTIVGLTYSTDQPALKYTVSPTGATTFDMSVTGFVTLSSITFPNAEASKSATPITLINGWQASTGGSPVAVKDPSGTVHLMGAMTGDPKTPAFILPPPLRPAHTTYVPALAYGNTWGWLEINSDGYVYPGGLDNAEFQYLSLGGVSYETSAPAGTENLTLLPGWASSEPQSNTGNPQVYKMADGVVELSGSMHGGNVTSQLSAFQLPAGDRPAHVMMIPLYTYGGSAGYISILPTGVVQAGGIEISSTTVSGNLFTSLDGVSFTAGV